MNEADPLPRPPTSRNDLKVEEQRDDAVEDMVGAHQLGLQGSQEDVDGQVPEGARWAFRRQPD